MAELVYGSVCSGIEALEVERCFGFPDNYTLVPGASDSARYEALGNSMGVPVMAWIGRRLQQVDAVRAAVGLDRG